MDGSLTTSNVTFDNNGEVRVDSGPLTLGGGGTSTGQFNTAEGTTITFASGSPVIATGATFGGSGEWRITGARVDFAGDTSISRLAISSGWMNGDGTVHITDRMDWTGNAELRGNGTTAIDATAILALSGDSDKGLHNRTLQIEGSCMVAGTGTLWLQSGSSIVTAPGSLVDFQADATWNHNYGTGPTVILSGTFRKTGGTGNTTLANYLPTLDNLTMEARTGTIILSSGATGSGTFDALPGATITFPTNTSLSASSFKGAGLKQFTGGTLTLTGATPGQNVEINGANLEGTHVLQGEWKWLAGDLRGEGTTTIDPAGTLRLMGGSDHGIHSRTLQVNGTFVDESMGTLWLQSGCKIQTGAGGTITFPGDVVWNHNYGTAPTFTNLGTIEKTAGGLLTLSNLPLTNEGLIQLVDGEMTTSNVTFNNTGAVDVDSGSLLLKGGGTSTGQFNTAEGTTISFASGSPVIAEGAAFGGTGEWWITGAQVNFAADVSIPRLGISAGWMNGDGSVRISEWMDWSGNAELRGNGTTVIAPTAVLTMSGGSDKGLHNRTLQIEGSFNVLGTGTLWLQSGSSIVTAPGSLVDFQADATWNHNYGTGPTVSLAGTFRKSGGTGNTSLANYLPTLDNLTMEALTGGIVLNSGATGSGTFDAAEGATISFPTTTSLSDSSFTGAGLKQFTGGNLTLSGTCFGENVELNGATLQGTQTLQGEWKWLRNDFNSEGTTTIDAGAVLYLLGAADRAIHTRTLQVNGTFVDEGTGNLWLQSGCSVRTGPEGVIELAGDVTWNHNYGTAPSLINEGTIQKTAGTGEARISNIKPVNESTGTIASNTGTLRLVSGLTGGGTLHAASGAVLQIENSSDLADVAFAGPGSTRLTGGDISLSGTCSAGNVELAGANILGTHTLEGTWHWFSGEFKGTGTTTLAGNAHFRIVGDAVHTIRDRPFINHGMITHLGNGNLSLTNGASLHNATDGIVNFRSDADWSGTGGTALVNDGVIFKTEGNSASDLDFADFQNNGSLVANTGFLTYDFVWVYHRDQGWIFQAPSTNGGFHYFDASLSLWAWSSLEAYPDLYFFAPFETWVHYLESTHWGNRWFYVYTQDDYFGEREYSTD